MLNILILCTGNSCRSILAEVLFNEIGKGSVTAYSAGSNPTGEVNPRALQKLELEGHSTDGLRSKNWDEFTGTSAPDIDIVISVCDDAAGKSCPIWNGAPVTGHWGIPDPARGPADNRVVAFELAYSQLRSRIEKTLSVPLESMLPQHRIDALHRIHDASGSEESECISS